MAVFRPGCEDVGGCYVAVLGRGARIWRLLCRNFGAGCEDTGVVMSQFWGGRLGIWGLSCRKFRAGGVMICGLSYGSFRPGG